MQAFRDVVRGWLGKSLLALLMVPFALVGIESYFQGGKEVIAARVDKADIPEALLLKAFDNQKQQLQSRLGADAALTPAQLKLLRERVLNSLIQRQLLLAAASDAGYRISDAAIQKMIEETPAFQENGKFSPSRYAQLLAQIGETTASFPRRAREEMLSTQRVAGLLQSAFVTSQELDQLGALDSQQRNVQIVSLPASRYLASVAVSDDEIKAYYDANAREFMLPERVSISHVSLSRDSFLARAQVTEEAVKARYDERVKSLSAGEQRRASHILIVVNDKVKDAEAKARIDALARQVAGGADFAALAKLNSQDPGSAANGGDLGFAGKGMFVPEFEKALFSLAKPGDVSAVVKSPFGYHLIKLTDVKSADVPTLASLRPSLEKEAREAAADELYSQAVEKFDATVYESADLDAPAREQGLSVSTTAPFDRKGLETGIAAVRKVIDMAFSEELVKEHKNSGAISLPDGSTAWIRVASHDPERRQPLTDVRAQVESRLRLQKAVAMARSEADKLVAASANGGLAAAATAAGLSMQTQDGVTRRSPITPAQRLREIYRAPYPQNGVAKPVAISEADGALVLAVTAVNAGPAMPAEQRKATQGMLAENRGQQELQDVIGLLRSHAKVEILKP